MKKTLLILVAFVLITTACENNKYVDGTYMASYDTIDSNYWKAFVEITVSDDMITAAEYNYWNPTGDTLKSNDPDYNALMFSRTGLNPEMYVPLINAAIMDAEIVPQFESINAVAGATHSSHTANILLAAALESAIVAGGDVIVPQPDPAK